MKRMEVLYVFLITAGLEIPCNTNIIKAIVTFWMHLILITPCHVDTDTLVIGVVKGLCKVLGKYVQGGVFLNGSKSLTWINANIITDPPKDWEFSVCSERQLGNKARIEIHMIKGDLFVTGYFIWAALCPISVEKNELKKARSIKKEPRYRFQINIFAKC